MAVAGGLGGLGGVALAPDGAPMPAPYDPTQGSAAIPLSYTMSAGDLSNFLMRNPGALSQMIGDPAGTASQYGLKNTPGMGAMFGGQASPMMGATDSTNGGSNAPVMGPQLYFGPVGSPSNGNPGTLPASSVQGSMMGTGDAGQGLQPTSQPSIEDQLNAAYGYYFGGGGDPSQYNTALSQIMSGQGWTPPGGWQAFAAQMNSQNGGNTGMSQTGVPSTGSWPASPSASPGVSSPGIDYGTTGSNPAVNTGVSYSGSPASTAVTTSGPVPTAYYPGITQSASVDAGVNNYSPFGSLNAANYPSLGPYGGIPGYNAPYGSGAQPGLFNLSGVNYNGGATGSWGPDQTNSGLVGDDNPWWKTE